MNNNSSNSHFWWVIGILSFIIICFIAVFLVIKTDHCVQSELVEVLGIISTLLAITLSVFSILFSYSTSSKADSALEKVGQEVINIEKTYTRLTSLLPKSWNAQNNEDEAKPDLAQMPDNTQEDNHPQGDNLAPTNNQ